MVGPRLVAVALALVAFVVPVNASMLETASGGVVSYQFDADNHHDAPDACAGADPAWTASIGTPTDGILVPPDDNADAFVVEVPASDVGSRLRVRVSEVTGTPQLGVATFAPSCLGDVFALQNQPAAAPTPPPPAENESTHEFDGHSSMSRCDGSGWYFQVTGLSGFAVPSTMHVAWTDGSEGAAHLVSTGNSTARYFTDQNLAHTLYGAWINLPSDWNGTFPLMKGPCDTVDGGAVYGQPATVSDDGSILSFTPIRPGRYVVLVTVESMVPYVPASVTMSCHHCLGPVGGDLAEKVSYMLRVDQVAS